MTLVVACGIGFGAGLLGGLAGIGGSMVILPGLAWALGYPEEEPHRHHIYMAAAMLVNVVVSVPAAVRHHRAGAVRLDVARALLPSTLVFILVGVWVSNLVEAGWLRLLLAGFIGLYCVQNILKTLRRQEESASGSERTSAFASGRDWFGCWFCGGVAWFGGWGADGAGVAVAVWDETP